MFTSPVKNNYKLPSDFPQSDYLQSVSVSALDVHNVLKSLPSKTSIDNDNLSYRILKEGGFVLAMHLANLFSLSLSSGVVPSAWKIGVVSPIHKSGAKNLVSNYRPISVTSCCCRVLERIVRNRINDFLSAHQIIHPTQHGFITRRSTDTILITFYDYVTEKLDCGEAVDTIFFDFSKAFDTVPHDILITRLHSSGISGGLLLWLKDFLTNRKQKVRVGSAFSDLLPVLSGVIQGSVLGPTLFNIFVNNVDTVIKYSHILKYADDIRIYLSSSKSDAALVDFQRNLQHDINSICKWVSDSGMVLNINKCFHVSFGKSPVPRSYSISGSELPCNRNFKDLGVLVSAMPLSFNNHMDQIVSKAFARLGLIRKIFRTRCENSTVRLFKAYVRPILEYASIVWNPSTEKYKNKIERVQRRMCKMIPAISQLHYNDQLSHLRLHSLRERRIRFQLISLYKFYNRLTDLDFHSFFKVCNVSTRTSTTTRGHKLKIIPNHSKHNYRLNFFTNSSIHLWNKLSDNDISAPTINDFKNNIDMFFRKHSIG